MKARLKEKARPLTYNRPGGREESVLNFTARCDSYLFDFDLDGGAVGDIDFERLIPAGALVTAIYSDELTALTSGGSATVQLKAGATDLTDALAFDTGFTGQDSLALASSAEAIKVSSASAVSITIATAALTAGKVRFYVQYLMPNE